MKLLLRILIAAAFGILILGQLNTVEADADVDSYVIGCESSVFTGSSTAPYIYVYMYAWDTSTEYVAVFPVSGDFEVEVLYDEQVDHASMYVMIYGSTEGATQYGTWDNGTYFEIYEINCQPNPEGPGVPSGYVLRGIVCDTPVYNSPGGSPVGDGRVLAGQTFYVDPTPVTALDGTSWTRIFVSSRINPYIPTACVN